MQKKSLVLVIVLVLLAILIFISFSFYKYFKSPEKTLGLGANIEQVLISEDGKTAYLKLKGGINEGNITKIKFIFQDKNKVKYSYETNEGAQEISVPFKRSFWDWFLGRQFIGKYDYKINSEELEIENFQDIEEIGVSFEYKTETGEQVETPPLDTAKPTTTPPQNRTTVGGGGGGDGGGTTCASSRDCSYYYDRRECGSALNDGCANSLNCSNNCNINETCIEEYCVLITRICTDNDADGYGVCPNCSIINNCSYNGNDCDDSSNIINPGINEICTDNLDNDCDNLVDCEDQDCSTNSACQVPTIPTNYVSYWKFDTETAGITPDEKGRNNGTLVNNAQIISDAERGNVLSLDGDLDYVDAGNDSSLNLQGVLTLMAWVKPTSWGVGNRGMIVSKGNGTAPSYAGFSFWVGGGTCSKQNTSHYVIYGGWVDNADSSLLELNKWQHVVLVYNQTNGGYLNFYKNGTKIRSALYNKTHHLDCSGNVVEASGGGPPLDSSQYNLTIGIRYHNIGISEEFEFNGSMDDIMIYNRALNESEILEIYNNQKPVQNTFYVSVSGGAITPHDGLTQDTAFTLAEAQTEANSRLNEEITFLFASGNYGNFVDNNARTSWATWKADIGATPIFESITIGSGITINAYLKFDSIKLNKTSGSSSMVRINQANNVEFHDGQWRGYDRYQDIQPLISGNNIVIDGIEIFYDQNQVYSYPPSSKVDGLQISGNNFTVKNCHIHDFSSSAIQLNSGSGLIENCYIHNQHTKWPGILNFITTVASGGGINQITLTLSEGSDVDDFYNSRWIEFNNANRTIVIDYVGATKTVTIQNARNFSNGYSARIYDEPKHGAGIALVNINNLTIRNNIVHAAGASGGHIFFYNPSVDNIVIENNLLYDGKGIAMQSDASWGRNGKFNNNIVVTNWQSSTPSTSPQRYARGVSFNFDNYQNDFEFYNNIIIAYMETDGTDISGESDNNIVYSFKPTLGWSGSPLWVNTGLGPNSVILNSQVSGYGWMWKDTLEGGGWDPEADFFVAPDFTPWQDNSAYTWSGIVSDFNIKGGSPAIGFADALVSNGGHSPLTDILGNSRDLDPDAGAYEYVEAGATALSPFAKIWNFLKGILTKKTANVITGKVVSEKIVSDVEREKTENFFIKIVKWFKDLIGF